MAKDAPPKPRLCHLRKWPDFAGYGFNLHAEKGRAGHFVGRVDAGSPAAAGGLRPGDRIVEVNGTNIGNENHQQVVTRIQLVPDETRILVVDPDADEFYRKNRVVVRSDTPGVELVETPVVNPFTKPPPPAASYKGKLCELKIWSNFIGYGFNLHAEKGNPSHIVGRVDPKSPAEATGMKEGDRILEVNGVSVLDEPHADVVKKIKSDPRKVTVLLVGCDFETFLREQGSSNPKELLEIGHFVCPENSPFVNSVNASRPVSSTTTEESAEQAASNNGLRNLAPSDAKDSSSAVASRNSSSSEPARYRLCHMKRSDGDAKSFGFTMHASKGQAGHFITEVDPNSIAERSGLRTGDRVIEVNGANVEAIDHRQAVDMIRTVPNETFLLVINDFKDHDCWIKPSKDGCEVEPEESNKNNTNISSDYRMVTNEMIEFAEREAKTHEHEAAKKSVKAMTSPGKNDSYVSYEGSLNSIDDSKSEDYRKSAVAASGIEFASSAEEARRRMKRKSRVKEENLSIRDKFRLFEKL